MSNKILVAYASRTGATAGVAEAIGKTLAENGTQVDVRPMTEVTDLAPYQAVVAGSAIQGKQWLPEAMQFMQTHQAALRQQPFAAFLVCMTLAMKRGDYRAEVANWLQPVAGWSSRSARASFRRAGLSKVPSWRDKLAFRLSVPVACGPRAITGTGRPFALGRRASSRCSPNPKQR